MYLGTTGPFAPGLGQPLEPLRGTFTSDVIVYKDKDGADQCRPTRCGVYIPRLIRYSQTIDLLVFFHGHDTCKKHGFNPDQIIANFRLDEQVEHISRPVALAVPSIFWNVSESQIIRAAWSALYINAFLDEVLSRIRQASSGSGRTLDRLILAGHSGAYDILTPLADRFDCGAIETKTGALARLAGVVAMDTTYGIQHAKSLEKWARNLPGRRFSLVLSNGGTPPYVWNVWERTRKKATGFAERPVNLEVHTMPKDSHCELPGKYLTTFV